MLTKVTSGMGYLIYAGLRAGEGGGKALPQTSSLCCKCSIGLLCSTRPGVIAIFTQA